MLRKILIYNFLLMNTMLFLTQLFWVYFVIIWLSVLFNKKFFKKALKEFEDSYLIIFFSWMITLFLGLYTVMHSNTYDSSVEIIISIIWWIALVKWTFLLLFPQITKKMTISMKWWIKILPLLWPIYIWVWAYLIYNGFFL